MASSILYPPTVDSYSPAFVANQNGGCRVFFSLSKFNTESDFECAHVAIYKQDSGLNVVNKKGAYGATGIILNVPVFPVENQDNRYYIEILNEDVSNGWQEGWVYKVQIRLSSILYDESLGQSAWINENANNFSEWSTTCYAKAIGNSSLQIKDYNYFGDGSVIENQIVVESLDFIGIYSNTDKSENLYSYNVKLYDSSMFLLEESKTLYANQYNNINQFSYRFNIEPENNKNYIVKISYETINKYTNFITFNNIKVNKGIATETNIYLATADGENPNSINSTVFLEEEEGRVGLKLFSPVTTSIDTTVMIRRADSRDNFKTWTDIKNITINNNIDEIPIIYDYTIESGIWYKYGVQVYTSDGQTVTRGKLNEIGPIMREFNYSYLLGKDNKQLKLLYNNNINNFKIVISEGINTTLGSQFPFISRNGNVYYKSFSISGLITFNMDENGLFFTKNDFYKENTDLYNNYNNEKGISHYDYIYEREFRNAVMEFLYDGKPKLFKSTTEGNILVRLTDIVFTPRQNLGRIVYDFSATATEIAKGTMENYKKYELHCLI